MIIGGQYGFNGGDRVIPERWSDILEEIEDVIAAVDVESHKRKKSKEKTMPGQMLYSPKTMNKAFDERFFSQDWERKRIRCDYPTKYYREGYMPPPMKGAPYREMDYIKDRLGIELQFGKYSFMVYNVCAKMTIFRNLGFIDAGVEIVPMKALADEMSSGVSYFEQFVWDLENRGVADIDIPVLILGIDGESRNDHRIRESEPVFNA